MPRRAGTPGRCARNPVPLGGRWIRELSQHYDVYYLSDNVAERKPNRDKDSAFLPTAQLGMIVAAPP